MPTKTLRRSRAYAIPAVGPLLLLLALLGLGVCTPTDTHAQTDASLVESDDTHYYDFLVGTWAQVVDGRPDTTATMFTLRPSVNPALFEERWRQVYDGQVYETAALRGWDQVTNRWMLTWVTDNALFQVWEGVKEGGNWYLVKEFEIDGQRVLSRQAWIPQSDTRLDRTVERSTDGGRTWTSRYHLVFEKVSDAR